MTHCGSRPAATRDIVSFRDAILSAGCDKMSPSAGWQGFCVEEGRNKNKRYDYECKQFNDQGTGGVAGGLYAGAATRAAGHRAAAHALGAHNYDDALCTFLLGRVGVNVRGLRDEADRAVSSLPQVTGGNGEQYFSQDASRVIQRAVDFTKTFGASMRRSNICCSA